MSDPSMNTGLPQEPRTVEDVGYNNVEGDVTYTKMPTVPYHKSAPVSDAADRTSNTHRIEVGPTANDITVRTRNG